MDVAARSYTDTQISNVNVTINELEDDISNKMDKIPGDNVNTAHVILISDGEGQAILSSSKLPDIVNAIATLNGDATITGSVDQKVLVETTRAQIAEAALQANINAKADKLGSNHTGHVLMSDEYGNIADSNIEASSVVTKLVGAIQNDLAIVNIDGTYADGGMQISDVQHADIGLNSLAALTGTGLVRSTLANGNAFIADKIYDIDVDPDSALSRAVDSFATEGTIKLQYDSAENIASISDKYDAEILILDNNALTLGRIQREIYLKTTDNDEAVSAVYLTTPENEFSVQTKDYYRILANGEIEDLITLRIAEGVSFKGAVRYVANGATLAEAKATIEALTDVVAESNAIVWELGSIDQPTYGTYANGMWTWGPLPGFMDNGDYYIFEEFINSAYPIPPSGSLYWSDAENGVILALAKSGAAADEVTITLNDAGELEFKSKVLTTASGAEKTVLNVTTADNIEFASDITVKGKIDTLPSELFPAGDVTNVYTYTENAGEVGSMPVLEEMDLNVNTASTTKIPSEFAVATAIDETVMDGELTIQGSDGVEYGTFSANQEDDETIEIPILTEEDAADIVSRLGYVISIGYVISPNDPSAGIFTLTLSSYTNTYSDFGNLSLSIDGTPRAFSVLNPTHPNTSTTAAEITPVTTITPGTIYRIQITGTFNNEPVNIDENVQF